MISERTIVAIEDLDIVEVVSRYLKLDNNLKARCPFHNENTPSFKVYKDGGFKCFGCGAGGNGAISFVMEHENIGFIDAVEQLASQFNIPIEYDEKDRQKSKAIRESRKTASDVLQYAFGKYRSTEHAKQILPWLEDRHISTNTSKYFQLGYHPDSSQYLTKAFVQKGVVKPATEVGLIKTKEKRTYDVYRNRIIIPIHDHRGQLLGFAGRSFRKESGFAKYINPPSSPLYNKSKVLFNLNRSAAAIKKANRTAYLVEGYMDATGLYELGIENVVAGCGTALTIDQAQLLHRYANQVYIFYDGDNAGRKATIEAIKILTRCNIRVSVISIPFEDPDDFSKRIREMAGNPGHNAMEELAEHRKHAMEWVIDELLTERCVYTVENVDPEVIDNLKKNVISIETIDQTVCLTSKLDLSDRLSEYLIEDPKKIHLRNDDLNEAVTSVLNVLTSFNEVVQDEYLDVIRSRTKLKKPTLLSIMKGASTARSIDEDYEINEDVKSIPKDCDREFFLKHHFAPNEKNTGYYFMTSDGGYELVGNFVIEPLFHIKGEESKRFVKVIQEKHERMLLLDSRAFGGIDTFGNALWDEGGLVFSFANRRHLDTLKKYWAHKFPTCFELDQLGWQPEGFWAFSNKVYNGKLHDYDDLGIYTHRGPKGGKTKFLSPAIAESLKEHRGKSDIYENDEYMAYAQASIDLNNWMALHYKVYGNHSIYGIAFLFLSVFRDIALAVEKIPHLYCYGAASSGKSSFADSLLHVIFGGKDNKGQLIKPFQLNTGTEFAFYNHLGRFQNGIAVLNEFDENTCTVQRHGTIKGAFDGEGREKGSGKKNKTTTQKINQNIILVGQFLVTMDGNSVPSRSILRSFPDKKFTAEEKQNHTELREYTDRGLSSFVCDILSIRDEVKELYTVRYSKLQQQIRQFEETLEGRLNVRLINHYTHAYAMLSIIDTYFKLPFSLEYAYDVICQDLKKQNDLVATGNSLNEFWDIFQNLANVKPIKILEGFHYKVEKTNQIHNWRFDSSDQWTTKEFDNPRSIIHIHLADTQLQYSQFLPPGKAMNKDNLRKYLTELDAYLGMTKSVWYGEGRRTSSMVFDFEMLKLDLMSQTRDTPPSGQERALNEHKMYVLEDAQIKTRLDKSVLTFKAGILDEFGDVERFSCVSRKTEAKAKLVRGAEFVATGKIVSASFKKDGQSINYNKFKISSFGEIRSPQVDSSQLSLEDLDNPDDDIPF